MRVKCLPLFLLLALAVGCSSSGAKESPGKPALRIAQSAPLFFGSGFSAPLNVNVDISNVAKEPIRVRRVRLEPGGGQNQYNIYPHSRIVSETIQPGETKTLYVALTAYTDIRRLQPTEPLGMRAIIDYEFGGTRYQGYYIFLQIDQ